MPKTLIENNEYLTLPEQIQKQVTLRLERKKREGKPLISEEDVDRMIKEVLDEFENGTIQRSPINQEQHIEQLQAEVELLKLTSLPTELTPLIKSVLGIMCFQIGHYAHVYQAAGFDIPKKAEEEQAFILHRWLLLALEHGDNWPLIAQKEVKELRAKADHAKDASHD